MGFIDLFPQFSKKDATKELGNSGLEVFSGFIDNDYNTDWRDDKRIETVQEMRNDGQVAAALRAVKYPIINLDWFWTVPNEDDPKQQEYAEYVKTTFEKPGLELKRILAQGLSMLDFGFMYFEKIWKVLDGVLVLDKLAPRLQSAHYKWEAENGEAGVTQLISSSLVKQSQFSIPDYKLLLFTFDSEGNDPSGMPLIRAAYIHWKIKNLLYKIEVVANERFRAGIPMAHYADQTVKTKLVDFLKNIISNQKAFGAFQGRLDPNSNEVKENIKFSFLTSPTSGEAKSSMDNIQHHNRMIAQSILAQHISLGETNGTQSLGDSFSRDFKLLLMYVVEHLKWTMNHLSREIIYWRYGETEIYPRLDHASLEDQNMKEYIESVAAAVESGLLDVEPKVKKQVRATLKLPTLSQEEEESIKNPEEGPEDKPVGEPIEDEPKEDEPQEVPNEEPEDDEESEDEKLAELDDVFAKYKATVNMSASELQAWSETECSKMASLDRTPITRNLRLLSKKKEDWDSRDIKDANRTISFVSRMKGNLGGANVLKDSNGKTCGTRAAVALRNWGYDNTKTNNSEWVYHDDLQERSGLVDQAHKLWAQLYSEGIEAETVLLKKEGKEIPLQQLKTYIKYLQDLILKKKDIEQLEELSKWDKVAQKNLNRVLTLAEQKVDFDAVQAFLDKIETDLTDQLKDLTEQQKTIFFTKLEKALRNEDVKAINEQATQLTGKIKTIIKTAALEALAFGKKKTSKEFKKDEPTTPTIYNQTIDGEIDDLLAKRNQNIESDVKSSIRESLLKGIGAIAAINAAKDIFDKKAKEGNQSITGYIPIENINRGRDIVHNTYSQDIFAVQRSEILDKNTCFPAGTQVQSKHGNSRIEQLKVGDEVYTRGGWNRVSQVMKRNFKGTMYKIITKKGVVVCTDNHPVFVDGEWKEARELQAGSKLLYSVPNIGWQIATFVNKLFGNSKYFKSFFSKKRFFSFIPRFVFVPIVAIHFKTQRQYWKKKINRISTNLFFLDKCNLQFIKSESCLCFNACFSCIFSITRKAAKSFFNLFRWSYPKYLLTSYTGSIMYRSATQFRTKISRIFTRMIESFSTSFTFLFKPFQVFSFASNRTKIIPISIRFKNRKLLTASNTYFNNTLPFISTFHRTHISEPSFRIASNTIKRFFTNRTNNKITCFLSKTFNKYSFKTLTRTILCSCAAANKRLITYFTKLCHKIEDYGPLIVYNIEVENQHEYFANNILVHNCNFCVSIDGRIMKPTDPFAKMGAVHSNCRGINVGVLKAETPLPTITGIPQSLRSKVETVEGVPRINTVTQPKEPIIRKDSRAYERINN